ncbi:hypothetical protein ACQKNX_02120 [Lysinibacillus sp. NPDC093712]|uniref:hypothetical protein n=1 Tax=Lysinibacillus sp. NPDC093712 TaxID=3390579 RepID=UPI003D00B842
MKIEVTHVIKADSQLISLFGAVLSALSTPSENLSVTDAVKLTNSKASKEKEEVSDVAEKTLYFVHEGSGAAIVVKKGEDITFLEKDIFDPISKAEYDKIQADKAALIEKAKQQAKQEAESKSKAQEVQEDAEQTSESEDHGITIEMVRAEATKLTSNGRQADFKAILTSFEAPKLSDVPNEKYPDLLAAIKKAVGEA